MDDETRELLAFALIALGRRQSIDRAVTKPIPADNLSIIDIGKGLDHRLPDGSRIVSDQNTLPFTVEKQVGARCIAQVIANVLPKGTITSDKLYQRHEQLVDARVGRHNDLSVYRNALDELGFESTLLASEAELIGHVLLGHPVVFINKRQWHAYAITGHEFRIPLDPTEADQTVFMFQVQSTTFGGLPKNMTLVDLRNQDVWPYMVIKPKNQTNK